MEKRLRREASSARRRLIGHREGQAARRLDAALSLREAPALVAPPLPSPSVPSAPCQRVTAASGAALFPAATTSAPEDEPHPGLVGATRRVRTESGPAQIALETPSGSYARHGIYESL